MSTDAQIHSGHSPGHSPLGAFEEDSSLPLRLEGYFLGNPESRAQYSDQDIQEISTHLQSKQLVAWSVVPRLYIVLRTIGQLQSLDDIISHGVNDYWFPFSASSVQAITLSSTMQNEFLKAQKLVLTRAVDLEKDIEKRHFHFNRGDTIPFKGLGELGRGGYAIVDKVLSVFSRREYARKLFKRQRGGNKTAVQSFINELRVLKKIHHRHCVELIASYTDAKYFGIVMSPIADGNLHGFYARVSQNPENVKALRTFFGCLTSAIDYLHESKIRHRDIKPENILVKGSDVYLTDFGISLDWENLSRGTTTADSGKTRLYCAPEVANYQVRNSSSDIWSLGCVFLEMCTVLKGRTTDEMRQSFKKRSDTHAFHANLPAIQDWLNTLRDSGSELDDPPLEWSASMLQADRNSRPLAQNLYKAISKCRSTSDRETRTFCADCCVADDEESTVGSVSDGELWADDLDDEVTSSALTNETGKLHGSKSSDQEALSGNSGSSVHPDSLDPLSQSLTVLQEPLLPVDWPNASHGSPTSEQNVAHSHFPSESSAYPLTKTNLPASSHRFGANLDTFRASLAKTQSLEQSALSTSSDTVSPELTNLNLQGFKKQLFATSPDPDISTQLERRPSGEFPPAQAREPEKDKRRKQGVIHEILTAQEALLDINESRRKHVLKLPRLSPLDWRSPSAFLEALEKDEQFMQSFRRNYPRIHSLMRSGPWYINRIVTLLIQNGLDVNSEAYQDGNGFSPLVCLLYWSKKDDFKGLFSFMIEAGADLSIRMRNKRGKPAVSLFWLAAARGSVWAVGALVQHDVSKPSAWLSDLHQSSLTHDQPKLLKFLIDYEGLELELDPQLDFQLACDYGSEGILKFLLDKFSSRIDIEQPRYNHTPLIVACLYGYLGVARFLLAHGASLSQNYDGDDGKYKFAPLTTAARYGYPDIVKLILEVAGNRFETDFPAQLRTALIRACLHGHVKAAQHLLAHGADPNAASTINLGQWSCLHIAARDGHTEIVKSLLDHGATASVRTMPLFARNTPLSLGQMPLSLGQTLVKPSRGQTPLSLGQTPLSLAQSAGHTEIVEMLIMAEARKKSNQTQEGQGKKKLAQDTKGDDKSP